MPSQIYSTLKVHHNIVANQEKPNDLKGFWLLLQNVCNNQTQMYLFILFVFFKFLVLN